VVEKEGSKKEKNPLNRMQNENRLFCSSKWIVLRFKTIHFEEPYFIGLEAIVLKEGKKRNKNAMIEKKALKSVQYCKEPCAWENQSFALHNTLHNKCTSFPLSIPQYPPTCLPLKDMLN
jgi:hypothetical protein